MRQIKIEYSFKNIDRDYETVKDVPETTTPEELESGLQDLRNLIKRAWQEQMTGYLELGEEALLVRMEELRSFKVSVINIDPDSF